METVETECTQQSADRPQGSLEVCGWGTGIAGQAVSPAYMHTSRGMESDVGSYFLIENANKRIHQRYRDVVPSRNKSESEDSAVSGGIKPSRVNKIGFSKIVNHKRCLSIRLKKTNIRLVDGGGR